MKAHIELMILKVGNQNIVADSHKLQKELLAICIPRSENLSYMPKLNPRVFSKENKECPPFWIIQTTKEIKI